MAGLSNIRVNPTVRPVTRAANSATRAPVWPAAYVGRYVK
jgi:hypothetical protein